MPKTLIPKHLFTDVGSDLFITLCALNFIEMVPPALRCYVMVHITDLSRLTEDDMKIFNQAQVRLGAFDNLAQMRDVVYTKENVGKFFKIN